MRPTSIPPAESITTLTEKIDVLTLLVQSLKVTLDNKATLPEQALCMADLCARWGVSERTVRRLIEKRKLRPIRGFDRHLRFELAEVKRFEGEQPEMSKQERVALLRKHT